MSLVNKKAAVLVKDVDSPNILVKTVLSLLGNKEEMTELSNQISALGKPNAAIDIKNEVMKLVGKESLS
jgi:UDP-N-acetylglucosamine--N-acetylmuramyl-(pentapeptide) pyrophosphoryl-undecaprenol N-acetylglucosamine transferase